MNGFFKKITGLVKVIIFSTLIIVIAVIIIFFIVKPWEKETIKIGAILPITGPGSNAGEVITNGLALAAQEINSWGGINGRKIEFIIVDSKTNPQEGKKVFNKIEAAHHPIIYITTVSSVSMALAPLADENEVVLVGLVVAAPKFTEQNEWVFRYWIKAESEIPPIMEILEELKIKELGILYLNDEYGTSVFEILKEEFEKIGGTVISESYESKETDYKEQIAKLKDMEAIYSVGFESHLRNVFKQLKEENFNGFILGSNGAAGTIVTSTPEANGVYIAAPFVYNLNFLFTQEAKEKYEAKYGKPFHHFAANGYDFVKIMASLLEDKEISRESVKSVFEEGFIYSGVFGSIEVKPGEHDIAFPLHPAQIVDGEVKYLR